MEQQGKDHVYLEDVAKNNAFQLFTHGRSLLLQPQPPPPETPTPHVEQRKASPFGAKRKELATVAKIKGKVDSPPPKRSSGNSYTQHMLLLLPLTPLELVHIHFFSPLAVG